MAKMLLPLCVCLVYTAVACNAVTTEAIHPPADPTVSHADLADPFIELSMGAEMIAVDMTMTMDCLNEYTEQFEQILEGQLVKAEGEMHTICPAATHVTLTWSNVNMMVMNNDVSLAFKVGVAGSGTDTLNGIQSCAYSLAGYLANFDNWKQPIWIDIAGCARLEFTSSQFAFNGAEWICPAQNKSSLSG